MDILWAEFRAKSKGKFRRHFMNDVEVTYQL